MDVEWILRCGISNATYLEDILEAAGRAIRFTDGLTYPQFEEDEKSQYATPSGRISHPSSLRFGRCWGTCEQA